MNIFEAFGELVNPGDIIFDVGGFDGNYSIFLARLAGERSKILTFEPHPHLFSVLTANVAASPVADRIIPFQLALSNRIGLTALYLGEGGGIQASTIVQNLASEERLGKDFRNVPVPTYTLDAICEEHNYIPNLLKIDVEGAEDFVLQGANNLLNNFRPTMILEFAGASAAESPVWPTKLHQMGYKLFVVDIIRCFERWIRQGSLLDIGLPKCYPILPHELYHLTPIIINLLAIHESKLVEGNKKLISDIPFVEMMNKLKQRANNKLPKLCNVDRMTLDYVLRMIKWLLRFKGR